MKYTIILKEPKHYKRVLEVLDSLPKDELFEVIIRLHKSSISVRQQGYYFVILKAIEKNTTCGLTVEELHFNYKKRWLIDIFCRNHDNHPGFAEMIESLRELWRMGLAKKAKPFHDHVVRECSLMDAKRDEIAEYLEYIIMAAAQELQYAVPPAEPDIMRRSK